MGVCSCMEEEQAASPGEAAMKVWAMPATAAAAAAAATLSSAELPAPGAER